MTCNWPLTCADTKEIIYNYRQYLNSEHWQNFRLSYFQENPCCCSRCQISNVILDLHHKHYKNIGKELHQDVQLLCRKCHKIQGSGFSLVYNTKAEKRYKRKKLTVQSNKKALLTRIKQIRNLQKVSWTSDRALELSRLCEATGGV